MTDIGYLQTKIRELNEKVDCTEKQIDEIKFYNSEWNKKISDGLSQLFLKTEGNKEKVIEIQESMVLKVLDKYLTDISVELHRSLEKMNEEVAKHTAIQFNHNSEFVQKCMDLIFEEINQVLLKMNEKMGTTFKKIKLENTHSPYRKEDFKTFFWKKDQ